MYANVLVQYSTKALDKTFTYHVPIALEDKIKVGQKVKIPFANKTVGGIVLSLNNNTPDIEVKDILEIDINGYALTKEQLELGQYLKKTTLCTLISAYQAMLPPSLKVNKESKDLAKFTSYLKLNSDAHKIYEYIENHQRNTAQIKILNDLLEKEQVKKNDYSLTAVKALLDVNLILEEKERSYRINEKQDNVNLIKMNEEQQGVFNKVDLNKYKTYLLQGVTGSGKTLVYMELIDKVINSGKTAIVLVPEICLTTQTVQRFYQRFGSDVAIFHSALSDGEKFDEYQKIANGEVKIVVGTRSSIFVPLKNIGIIIIDEEHSDNYKQDSQPRYNAKDVAKHICEINNIPLILTSATPSLEARARADKKVYELLRLDHRVNNLLMPKVDIVDMTDEIKKGNTIFSTVLKDTIKTTLDNNEQIILLLNRRGFSTFINCKNCGYVYKCPNCDITLTYHKSTNNLKCHYCGLCFKKDDLCPECHEDSLNYLGLGTQKVEEELYKLFPDSKIVRMDQDTTMKKGSYQKMIDDFASEKYNILLGTQMISKGLDFKKVSLVGVINADTSLNIPDFRAAERTFSLLSQTSGRSGRCEKQGKVIIQTYNADNKIFEFVKNNDYDNFYLNEMNVRHILKYPPYTFIALLKVGSTSYEYVSKEVNKIKKILERDIDSSSVIYGPNPAPVFRVNNVYTFQIIIKYKKDGKLFDILQKLDEYYASDNKLSFSIDIDPSRF